MSIVKDPTHPAFPHGTTRGFSRGCDCRPCHRAHLRGRYAAERARACGALLPTSQVSAARAHTHLTRLLADPDYGHVANLLACVDVDPSRVHKVLGQPDSRIAYATERSLLAISTERLVRLAVLVRPRQAVQQYHSLRAFGWSGEVIADRLGYTGQHCPPWIGAPRQWLRADTARAMAAVYAELSMTPGPNQTSARSAQAAGWHPPLAYDEMGHLLPDAVRRNNKAERAAERREQVLLLSQVDPPLAAQEIADRVGVTPRTVERIRAEARAEAARAEAAEGTAA